MTSQAVVKDYVELGFDKLPEKMEFFRELLYSKAELPLVIYGHCEVMTKCSTYHVVIHTLQAGTDRTGEVVCMSV